MEYYNQQVVCGYLTRSIRSQITLPVGMTMSEPVQIQITLVGPVDQQFSARVIKSKLMLLIKLIQQIAPEFEIKFDDPAIAIAHEQLPRPEMPGLASYHGDLSVYIGPAGNSPGYAGQII